ncbi:phosphopantothenate/pantothenate synthetase [archaeon]|nr:phosphopantothenate/pantothenate synthetase [archaeon]
MMPDDHPRYKSLKEREALIEGYKKGITAEAGLIAHGRGEAFDYLLGEVTTPHAKFAIKAGAAALLLGENPVISVNGNTAALCPDALVELSDATGAKLEINLFYRSDERVKKIEEVLRDKGAKDVLGPGPDKEIEGLSSERRKVTREGIYKSDVVLVPLEDGDRTEALVKMGKKVIAIDLNPLSRTAQTATITIVDNVTRAIPELVKCVNELKKLDKEELLEIQGGFDNEENLKDAVKCIRKL